MPVGQSIVCNSPYTSPMPTCSMVALGSLLTNQCLIWGWMFLLWASYTLCCLLSICTMTAGYFLMMKTVPKRWISFTKTCCSDMAATYDLSMFSFFMHLASHCLFFHVMVEIGLLFPWTIHSSLVSCCTPNRQSFQLLHPRSPLTQSPAPSIKLGSEFWKPARHRIPLVSDIVWWNKHTSSHPDNQWLHIVPWGPHWSVYSNTVMSHDKLSTTM